MLRTFALDPSQALVAHVTGEPVTPRAASTVLLLRDGAEGPQVFVLRRAASMAFAPSMHAFPGGGVDPRDADPAVPWVGPGPAWWARSLGTDEVQARELVSAAVRELFEESGVLLAGRDATSVVGDDDDDGDRDGGDDHGGDAWEADRLALLDRSLALSELLGRRSLALRSDLLRPWAHWLTPEHEPRRYDTRFFIAALPPGQQARDVGGEADHAGWLGARAAVQGQQQGRLAMLAPTLVSLEEVAAHPDVASVLAVRRRVGRVTPWLVDDGLQVDLDGIGGGVPR